MTDQTTIQPPDEGQLYQDISRMFGELSTLANSANGELQEHSRMMEQVMHQGGARFTALELHQLLTHLVTNLSQARQLIRSASQAARAAVNAAAMAEDRRRRQEKTIGMSGILQAAAAG